MKTSKTSGKDHSVNTKMTVFETQVEPEPSQITVFETEVEPAEPRKIIVFVKDVEP